MKLGYRGIYTYKKNLYSCEIRDFTGWGRISCDPSFPAKDFSSIIIRLIYN